MPHVPVSYSRGWSRPTRTHTCTENKEQYSKTVMGFGEKTRSQEWPATFLYGTSLLPLPFHKFFSSPNQLDISLSPLLIPLQSIPQRSCAAPKYTSWLLIISFIFPKAIQKVIQRLLLLRHCDGCHSQTTGQAIVPKKLGEGLEGFYKYPTLPLFIRAPSHVCVGTRGVFLTITQQNRLPCHQNM